MSNRGSRGKGQQRLLYWFRTPPGVRVGRSAIDEDAIRLLEQHNPEIQFDWSRILREPPPAQPRKEERRGRDRDRRGPARDTRPAPQPSRPPATRATVNTERSEGIATDYTDYTERREGVATDYTERPEGAATEYTDNAERPEGVTTEYTESPEGVATDYTDYTERPEEVATESAEYEQVAAEYWEPVEPVERRTTEETEPAESKPAASAAEARLGGEGLARLRGRYAEVMARISERPLDEDTREQLKQRAERLNPDAWVTTDEVTQALEVYESVYEELRALVGTRHRRRRGRGRPKV